MTAHLERDVADVARKWVPDTRLGVFEVTVQPGALAGCTTSRDALAALRRVAAGARLAADIRLLPDSSVGDEQAAVVTAAVAPLVREPRVNADRVSEAVHGETLEVLERRSDTWLRVRAGDGYLAWVHSGYVSLGTTAWAEDWAGRATVRSLGAELRCEGARFRLAVGARAAPQRGGRVETADGRVWDVAAGVLRPEIELRVEARLTAARDASCTRLCRAAASSRTTCSPTRRRCGGCGSFWWRCDGWKRPIGETAPLGSHPEGWAIIERMKLVLFDIDGTLLWTDGAGR